MMSAAGGSVARMYRELVHQANIMAFSDAFLAVAVLMGTLAVVALFMPYNNPRAKPSEAAASAH
jgi:DHA2 family multidrug resistance protein